MSLNTQPYKGARDFYPEDKRIQKYMFSKLREVVESFGYQEYDAPILEPLDIYKAKSGEEIVNEQTYSFTDRGDRQVAIRPEMTPSVSRMVAGRRQELAYPLRWYSIPNLWRYERPQRGRLREHWQLNVDLFGVEGIEADHEVILVADAVLQSFDAPRDSYTIRVNDRKAVSKLLEDLGLAEDHAHDAFKLIDRKNKVEADDFAKQANELLGDKATAVVDYLNNPESSSARLNGLIKLLKDAGVSNVVYDPSVIRGLDYYTDIVFEVYDEDPENNRSMFGGGRYDGLVAMFGVEPVPTVGFGMGDVTLQNFLTSHNLLPELKPETNAAAILIGDVYETAQKPLAELRKKGLNIAVDSSGKKIDSQIKNAVKSGVRYALFIGEEELKSGQFKLRDLQKGEEQQLDLDAVARALSAE